MACYKTQYMRLDLELCVTRRYSRLLLSFLFAPSAVARTTMPRTGRTRVTFALERFKRQFWQWYCIDFFELSQVTQLFTWLFAMLAVTESSR